MQVRSLHWNNVLLLTLLLGVLVACGSSLPSDAQDELELAFYSEPSMRIHSAEQVEPLAVDREVGAEEVWCVNVTFSCWTCDYGEYRTCSDSRLVRRVGDEWQVVPVLTEDDRQQWEARGCELMTELVSGY
jgi:hypothetical protein